MRSRSLSALAAIGAAVLGCSHAPAAGGADGAGAAGGADACASTFTGDLVHLAAGATLPSGADQTYCLRWTTPDELDLTGFAGTLGPGGHHALLLTPSPSSEPDGLALCAETTVMNAEALGPFGMVAGVSSGGSGQRVDFPTTPSKTGLRIPKGTQLLLDAHLINPTSQPLSACVSIDLTLGTVEVPLDLRTMLPVAEYALSVPPHGSVSVSYPEPSSGSFRILGAWAHMFDGGTEALLSIKQTGATLYETDDWAEANPELFSRPMLIDSAQSFQLDCSFENDGSAAVGFPDQLCVGAMYLLSCAVPGAC